MAPAAQEPEVILAQRLASNDKAIRSKALKSLRRYITLRSQKVEGGFSCEDLLKIWKGLFYCLWMQDKPLLQEDISHRISGLIHSFHTTDNQLLYFSTFLQTLKREWDGIDRLRMDKFFQLVRFMFRQTFELLKRKQWETSVVNQFLQIFTEQVLVVPNTGRVPKGLMLHILDLYMEELGRVGSAELTAEQNLSFIDPFCKTMAKTKDHLLLTSISKNIFRTIVDHAPYAIEDLMRELQQGGGDDSDSGQASGEEEEIGEEEEQKNKAPKKTNVKVNGISEVVENSKDDLDLDIMDSIEDDSVGPVLQFDYGAIADHLFKLGSHLNTQNINRTKMYSLVKIFRDLSEGIFPQNEDDKSYRSDASDDELFNKKKSKKKKRKNDRPTTGDETLAKKNKACQDEQKPSASVQDGSLKHDSSENLKKTEKNKKQYMQLTDTGKAMVTSHVPLEAALTPTKHDMEKEREVLTDSQLKTSEVEADGETVFQHIESQSNVKKKRKSKKLKTNSEDMKEEVAHQFQLVLEESDLENQTDSCEAVMQKRFKATSGVGSTRTNADVQALNWSGADLKPEMSPLVESPVEAEQAECGISLTQEKTKKKKKKVNVGEEKMDTESSGQIVEKTPEISLQGHLESTETEVEEAESQNGDPGELEASTMVRKKKRKSKKMCLSVQEVGHEEAVQSLPKEHNADDEIRKLCTPQKVEEDNNAIQSRQGKSTTQKKVKSKKMKSILQEVDVAVYSLAILEDTDKHNNNDDISTHPISCKTQCRVKESTTKKKKGARKKLISSSQEVGKKGDSTSQDGCAEVVATDVATSAAKVSGAEAQASKGLMVKTKKIKKAKEETESKLQIDLRIREHVVSSDSAHIATNEYKSDTNEYSQPKSMKKAKKQVSLNDEKPMVEAKKQPEVEAASTKQTPRKKKKIQKNQKSQPAEVTKEEPSLKKTVKEKEGTEVAGTVSSDICTPEIKSLTKIKKGKKKRTLQTDGAEMSQSNGQAEEEVARKKVKISGIKDLTSVTPKKLKMNKASPKSDFVSFQGLIKPPSPLFCKTKAKGSMSLTSIKSDSKKVTFGLKNNKTTEFRKMDRSLLVSPVGSSRVAFDPKKMPVSGVLKSPSPSPILSVKKPAAPKRATAADFF